MFAQVICLPPIFYAIDLLDDNLVSSLDDCHMTLLCRSQIYLYMHFVFH